jgi:hypothetical protein
MTPSGLKSRLTALSSESVAPCTESIENQLSSQNQRMFVCNNHRKRKANVENVQRWRSNPAVCLIDSDALPDIGILPIAIDLVFEVIPLSSDGSTFTLESSKTPKSRKGKDKLPIIDNIDDYSDEYFVPNPEAPKKESKKLYEATRKFHDT